MQLTLTDADAGEDTDSTTITVNNLPPVVDAGVAQRAIAGRSVTFAGSFTDPGTADTHTFDWDFGDATSSTGSLTPIHVFSSAGVYSATLTVTDDNGGVDSDDVVITIDSQFDILMFVPVIISAAKAELQR